MTNASKLRLSCVPRVSRQLVVVIAAMVLAFGVAKNSQAVTVTVAVPNNNDLVEMKKLSPTFEKDNPDIQLKWIVLEENVLRQRLTTDITTDGGQFDVAAIGTFEAPLWGQRGWLVPITELPESYDLDDVLKSVRNSLSKDGILYALPFNAESSMTFYRKDLFAAKGLTMPSHPTYTQVGELADKVADKAGGIYGICLRAKAGWGENMAFISTLANTFGGRYFDETWKAQIDSPEWKSAINFYVDILKKDGPPGASSDGFNENLVLMSSGKCAIWIDATSAAGILYNKSESSVADQVGFAAAPTQVTPNGSHWLWSWALAIPKSSKSQDAAKRFITWATSKAYITLVGKDIGWASLPPGTRKSTYERPEYRQAAPFSEFVLNAIQTANPDEPTLKKVPYTGIQYVGIPEFQSFGSVIGQQIAGAVAGQIRVDQALQAGQAAADRAVRQSGYQK